ncbi:MAG: anti-sigma factor antagonist [Chloroflexi bacterium]|nr:MAG: anti-sigma factor antagonist [Chloroflexota bacterium]
MEINVTQDNGRVPVTVFHLDGELASDSYEALETQARQAIADGTQYLLLDMTRVPYMSSAGIRAIHQIFNWLRSLPDGEDEAALKTGLMDGTYKSRRLKLLNPSGQVLKTLATAGIDMYLEMHNDQSKAVASF